MCLSRIIKFRLQFAHTHTPEKRWEALPAEALVGQQGPASAIRIVQMIVLNVGSLAVAESHFAVLLC